MSSILLDRPSAIRTVPTASVPSIVPVSQSQPTVITLSVELPAGTSPAQAAAIADALRINADRYAASRGGRTRVRLDGPTVNAPAVNHPGQGAAQTARSRNYAAQNGRRAAQNGVRALQSGLRAAQNDVHALQGAAHAGQLSARATSSLRPLRSGAVSPTSPARRDADAARLRLLQTHQGISVSPVSPTAAPSASGLLLDLYGRRVRINNEDVDLTHKEFELLAHLARHARTVVTRDELMVEVWADAPGGTSERTIDVHVRRLRNKLGAYRRLVSTVRGVGYRLDPGSDVTIIGRA